MMRSFLLPIRHSNSLPKTVQPQGVTPEYYRQHRYGEAEPLYRRALQLYEEMLGQEHRYVADSLHWLAHTYHAQGKYAEAEPLFKRALAMVEKTLGPDHQEVGHHMKDYAALLRKLNREAEAAELEARAKAIKSKQVKEDRTK